MLGLKVGEWFRRVQSQVVIDLGCPGIGKPGFTSTEWAKEKMSGTPAYMLCPELLA